MIQDNKLFFKNVRQSPENRSRTNEVFFPFIGYRLKSYWTSNFKPLLVAVKMVSVGAAPILSPAGPREESVLESFFNALGRLAFDKAKELMVRTRFCL